MWKYGEESDVTDLASFVTWKCLINIEGSNAQEIGDISPIRQFSRSLHALIKVLISRVHSRIRSSAKKNHLSRRLSSQPNASTNLPFSTEGVAIPFPTPLDRHAFVWLAILKSSIIPEETGSGG